jgi:serine protease Do
MSGPTSYLGVGIREVDADRVKALKLKEEAGVEILHVEDGSPAEKAGIKAGDVILEFNGQKIEGIEQFSRMVRETPAGRDVKLGVVRGGSNQTIVAKIAARQAQGMPAIQIPDIGNIRLPDMPRTRMAWRNSVLGIEAESVDGQLAEYFGVKEGVLVRSVNKGSLAEKAGIRTGDVITRVDNGNVASPSDVAERLRMQRGKSVPVVVMRERKETPISVMIPNDDHSERLFLARPFERPALL